MSDSICVVFDTETTGLLKPSANDPNEQPYIIELSAIKFYLSDAVSEGHVILDTFSSLIKPPIIISDEITRITTITNEMLDGKPAFPELYEILARFMTGVDTLIGHNLPFDRAMLANELIRLDKLIMFPWPMYHYCTIEHSMHLEGFRQSLGSLYEKATGKSELIGAHRAEADAWATLECYKFLINNGMSKSVNPGVPSGSAPSEPGASI